MMRPSAAMNGNEFSSFQRHFSVGMSSLDEMNFDLLRERGSENPKKPFLWSRTLDKTGQIGESGIWEPVKWQSPGGHHLHTDYVGFKKEYTTEIQWEPAKTDLSTGTLYEFMGGGGTGLANQ